MHSIRTFAEIPRTVSKRRCTASPPAATTTTGASCASPLALAARCAISTWSIGRLLPGGRLSGAALALLAS
jgi:hypothetical protein